MLRSLRRLAVLNNHLQVSPKRCSSVTLNQKGFPAISVKPDVGLVDEPVRIELSGLGARQDVTLIASLVENGVRFESRCVYETDDHGKADNHSTASTAGSFLGLEPMGLFWSLKSDPPARLVKKDVGSPMVVNIKVFQGSHTESTVPEKPLAETIVQRFYKKPGVRRIPLEGKFRGTVFVPDGKGPFPALVDMFGGIVTLIETRAALLASHGYVAMALSYIHVASETPMDVDGYYIRESFKWLMKQDYVDPNRLGAIGLCYGGTQCLKLATAFPQIKAVVNLNGLCLNNAFEGGEEPAWPDKHKVFHTDEGFNITEAFNHDNPEVIQAWQHGAKIIVICGEDDQQVHPKWHSYFYEMCPEEYKQNVQVHRYHGAGHMIEPPFTPHIRSTVPGRKRLQNMPFVPEKYHDLPMMAGGWTATHAHAQEDSWKKILQFLELNLKS